MDIAELICDLRHIESALVWLGKGPVYRNNVFLLRRNPPYPPDFYCRDVRIEWDGDVLRPTSEFSAKGWKRIVWLCVESLNPLIDAKCGMRPLRSLWWKRHIPLSQCAEEGSEDDDPDSDR